MEQTLAELLRAAGPATANPNLLRQGRNMRPANPEVPKLIDETRKFIVGETPGEMLFNVGVGAPGKMLKIAGMGAAALAGSGDAEAGIGRLAKIGEAARSKLARLVAGEGNPGDVRSVMQDLQQNNMQPEQYEKLQNRMRESESFADAAPYMLPGQASKAAQSSQSAKLYDENWGKLPQTDELITMARAGEPKRGWYKGARETVGEMLPGQEGTTWAYGKSALSPQTSVQSNAQNIASTYFPWRDAGSPTDAESISKILRENVQQKPILGAEAGYGERSMAQIQSLARSVGVPDEFIKDASPEELRLLLSMFQNSNKKAGEAIQEASVLPAWKNNFGRAVRGETTLSGPKVDSFAANLDPNNPFASLHTTNDTWDSYIMGLKQQQYGGSLNPSKLDPGYSPAYTMSSAKKAQAADKMGWLPEEVQETTWSWAKPIGEGGEKSPLMLPPEVINEVPDFQTLLRDPKIFNLLPAAEQKRIADMPAAFSSTPQWTPSEKELQQLQNAKSRILRGRATRND